jgi:hypothetical protein
MTKVYSSPPVFIVFPQQLLNTAPPPTYPRSAERAFCSWVDSRLFFCRADLV